MSIFNVGRLCVKLAGRDAGRKCVVVEQVDKTFVMVDGDVRRKKVNMRHLEPLAEVIEINDKASHDEVTSVFKKLGLNVWEKKSKQAAERPKKQKVKKVKPVKEKKAAVKKEEKVAKTETKVEEKAETKTENEAEIKESVIEEAQPVEQTVEEKPKEDKE